MSVGIGLFEIVILAVLGLLCVGLPIGIIAALMARKPNDDDQ